MFKLYLQFFGLEGGINSTHKSSYLTSIAVSLQIAELVFEAQRQLKDAEAKSVAAGTVFKHCMSAVLLST